MLKRLRFSAERLVSVAVAVAIAGQAAGVLAQSQANSPEPYASIASRGVSYLGPGRDAAYDLAGPTISIGLLVPLQGPRKADGEAIVAAAQMALADAAKDPLPGGMRLSLAVGDESGPSWSGASNSLMRLVLEEQAVAVVTSADGATAHLSEQVGNRMGVAVLTLSSDKTTTQIDLPWIFRMGPSDAVEALAFAEDIDRLRSLHRVLLVIENDHDGRCGRREFQDAAKPLGGPSPAVLTLDPLRPDIDVFLKMIREQAPDAVVLWTRGPTAALLVEETRSAHFFFPLYLSQEAAQESSGLGLSREQTLTSEKPGGTSIWTIASSSVGSPFQRDFTRRFQQARGVLPSPVAAEAYDAIRLIALALHDAGPNRARVRDRIANFKNWTGVSGEISFDTEGNNISSVRLVRLQ